MFCVPAKGVRIDDGVSGGVYHRYERIADVGDEDARAVRADRQAVRIAADGHGVGYGVGGGVDDDTVLPETLATYAYAPSGVTATPNGSLPTGMVAMTALVAVLIIAT